MTPIIVSLGQQRLWALDFFENGSASYNMPFRIDLTGELDLGSLEKAVLQIVQRHQPLRTIILENDGDPFGYIQDAPAIDRIFSYVDLSDLSEHYIACAVEDLAKEQAYKIFNLAADYLIRFCVIKHSATRHVLLVTLHHSAADGVSIGLLFNELIQSYLGRPLPSLEIDYSDYAAWQRDSLEDTEAFGPQTNYWVDALSGAPQFLTLPSDRARTANRSKKAKLAVFDLPMTELSALESLARKFDTTVFALLLAGYAFVLGKIAGQRDVVIGTTVDGRSQEELEPLIGFFVNTLAIRISWDAQQSIKQFLEKSAGVVREALVNNEVPFERIVEKLDLERSTLHNPLFQAMLTWQPAASEALEWPGFVVDVMPVDVATSKFDLNLSMVRQKDGSVTAALEYDASLFDDFTIQSWIRCLRYFYQALPNESTDSMVGLLPLSSPEASQAALHRYDGLAAPHESNTLTDLFERSARQHSDRVALVDDQKKSVTYSELHQRANQLARFLLTLDAGPEGVIAILLDRSVEAIVAMLAVLKTGAAYLPIDPSQPASRIQYILEDSGASVLVTQKSHAGTFGDCVPVSIQHTVLLDTEATLKTLSKCAANPLRPVELAASIHRENLAYLIYTSGSTGNPKGAGISHASISDHLLWRQSLLSLTVEDVVLQKTPQGFDVSVWEWCLPLIMGSKLVITTPEGHKDSLYLKEVIQTQGVTVLHFVASMLEIFLEEIDEGECAGIAQVVTSGEAVSGALQHKISRILPKAKFWNMYGPTEATIDVTYWLCRPEDLDLAPPIGHAVWNTQLFILDEYLSPVVSGVVGELYIAGDPLARGYLGKPGLTSERFIACPYSGSGARMYRTGDLARRRGDGAIQFLGRADDQVKIRGNRIELGEIETTLVRVASDMLSHVCVSAVQFQNDVRLVAYVVPRSAAETLDVAILRARLTDCLPEYMVPSQFVSIERLPVGINGKLDRKKLPAPQFSASVTQKREPNTASEQLLCSFFEELVGVPSVGVDDNFFSIGGHSLLAMRLVTKVRQITGVTLPLKLIFDQATPFALGQVLEQARGNASSTPALQMPAIEKLSLTDSMATSFAQERLLFMSQFDQGYAAYNMPSAIRLKGLLNVKALEWSLGEVIRRHQSLRTSFGISGEQTFQKVHPFDEWQLEQISLESLPDGERLARAHELAASEATQPFDLGKSPMLRSKLLKLSTEDFVLLLTIHHISSDGWSVGVLQRELTQLYRYAISKDPALRLAELSHQYTDFAVWQRQWLNPVKLSVDLNYWKQELSNLSTLELPLDFQRPPVQSYNGQAVRRLLPSHLCAKLNELARVQDATLFMVLMAGFMTLMSKWSGQTDVVVGTPIANRVIPELEPMIGFFVNSLVMRAEVESVLPFSDLIASVRASALKAYEHQNLPFEKLVEAVAPKRDLARHPLYQVVFALQNNESVDLSIPNVVLEPFNVLINRTRYELECHAWEGESGIELLFTYNEDLFKQETILLLAERFQKLLETVVEQASIRIADISIFSVIDKYRVIAGFNNTQTDLVPMTIVSLFSERVHKQPDGIAVQYKDSSLSYSQLNASANQLAQYLLSCGVIAESMVAIALPRSMELVCSMLAVLKSGAAFLPIDVDYPISRIHYVMSDSRVGLLLTTHEAWRLLQSKASEAGIDVSIERVIFVDDSSIQSELKNLSGVSSAKGEIGRQIYPQQLAYAIYTSGSTGAPKPVGAMHSGVVNLYHAQTERFAVAESARVLQFASPAFDAAVSEIFVTLLAGATLVMADAADLKDPVSLVSILNNQSVSHVTLPPALLSVMTPESLRGITSLAVAGEACPPNLISDFGTGRRMINAYGPTEITVCASMSDPLTPSVLGMGSLRDVPIGRPNPNTEIYLLNDTLSPVPIGTPGEIYISGVGVTRGYLNRPGLSAERFIANPFGLLGSRMYRSGDIGSWDASGQLHFLGRADDQVKIRGYRIEPGEIQAVIEQLDSVEQAIVVPKDIAGELRLIAYVSLIPGGTLVQDSSSEELSVARRDEWLTLYDDTHSHLSSDEVRLNVSGWNSSYNREAIAAQEMDRWRSNTVDRIRAISKDPAAVQYLEIGCGTGLLMWLLADDAASYVGTDFSGAVLDHLAPLLKKEGFDHVTLIRRQANEFEGTPENCVDVAIINSVIQYFPTLDYLKEVIHGGVRCARDSFFVGDVRSLFHENAFYVSVSLAQADLDLDVATVAYRARAMRERERELLVHPAFFYSASNPDGLAQVDLQIKRGKDDNEMLRYRYDVVVKKGKQRARLKPDSTTDWRAIASFNSWIRALDKHKTHELRDIPNLRIYADVWSANSIATAQMSVRDFIAASRLACDSAGAIDPEILWLEGEACSFSVRVTWSLDSPECVHALFEPKGNSDRYWCPNWGVLNRTWNDSEFVNDPLEGSYKKQQIDRITSKISSELPAYMLPSGFVVVDQFPLSQNGKIDKSRLPDPEISVKSQSSYVAPTNDLEQLLVNIFMELTGAAMVGVDDNFFDLGGHSLLAMRLVSKVRTEIGLELPLQVLFEHPTVRGLAVALHSTERESAPGLISGSGSLGGDLVRLSLGQIRLWTIDQLEGQVATYNMPSAYRIAGQLDIDLLRKALATLLQRHQALRTVISAVDGVPVGKLLPIHEGTVPFRVVDLTSVSAQDREGVLRGYLDEDSSRPFDLSQDFLLRSQVFILGNDSFALMLNVHHIAADGVSINIILRELADIYAGHQLDNLSFSYSDYAVQHEDWLQRGESKRQVAFWKQELQDAPELLTLVTDHPRTGARSMVAAHQPVQVDGVVVQRLEQLARTHRTTLFSIMLAGYAYLLSKLSNQADVVVGIPVAGRNRTEIDGLVGFFVNTLALHVKVDPCVSANDYFAGCAQTVLNALSHQDAPFERVVEELGVRRSLSQSPVFQAMFAWHIQSIETFTLGGLNTEPIATRQMRAKCDLTLSLVPLADGTVVGGFEYDASLYDQSTALRWAECLNAILTSIAEGSPDQRLGDIELLSNADRVALLSGFNQDPEAANALTLCDLLRHQELAHATRTALIFETEFLTYKELSARSNQLARYLISLKIGPNDLVALDMPRSIDLLVCMLGVLKAGAAYLPMDPDYPKARLQYMLDDSKAVALLATRHTLNDLYDPNSDDDAALLSACTDRLFICLDEIRQEVFCSRHSDAEVDNSERVAPLTSKDLAYVIYTSGSTGQPKGVCIPHDGIVNFAQLQAKIFDVNYLDRVLQFASPAFDAAVSEIYLALTTGAALVLAPSDQLRDPVSLPRILAENEVTYAALPPSLLAELTSDDIYSVRSLTVAGETCPPSIVERFAAGRRMSNGYGPTEVTVGASINSPIDPHDIGDKEYGKISIGSTLPNKQVYILDAQLNPVPVGVVGELYVSGVGLARGYLARPGMTAERFVACPVGGAGERMYRTGDLGSWRPSGFLDFHGRADQQVKVRGFRIELTEIESAIALEKDVRQVVVIPWDYHGEVRIVAYLVSDNPDAAVHVGELRTSLATKLPDHMIPVSFTFVDSFKQTSNGKLDRKQLPDPDFGMLGSDYRCPRSPIELIVSRAFAELTGAKQVGLDDNFFSLGGHSLLAMRLIANLRDKTGVTLPLRKLFEIPTVEGISRVLSDFDPIHAYQPLLPLKQGSGQKNIFCLPAAGGNSITYRQFANLLPEDFSVWGLQAKGSELNEDPHQSIEEMADAYAEAILSLEVSGPVILIGWSFGGNVCHALAQRLEELGYSIESVIILDSQANFVGEAPPDKDLHEFMRETAKDFGVEFSEDESQTFARFVDRFVSQGLIPPGTPPAWAKRVLSLMIMSEKLRHKYQPRPIRAPIALFVPEEGLEKKGIESAQSWSDLTIAEVTLHGVPGSHMTMLDSPAVESIVQTVTAAALEPD